MSIDPIFFLHHVQLDRLWWEWQSKDPGRRVFDYGGRAFFESPDQAALNDSLSFSGFAKNMTVVELMSTDTKTLCYRY